jgi:hypothetical protein
VEKQLEKAEGLNVSPVTLAKSGFSVKARYDEPENETLGEQFSNSAVGKLLAELMEDVTGNRQFGR